MLLLVGNDAPLGPGWLDRPLTGEWNEHRECHVGGDYLLVYKVDDSVDIVPAPRTGLYGALG